MKKEYNLFKGPKPATNFIIDYVLPFILADNDEKLEKAYFPLEDKACKICNTDTLRIAKVLPNLKSVLMFNPYAENPLNPEYIETLNQIKEVRSFIKLSLYLALNKSTEIAKSNEFKYENSDGTIIIINSKQIEEHVKAMKELLDVNEESEMTWSCPGKCHYQRHKKFFNSFELVKRTCILSIQQSLSSEFNSDQFQEHRSTLEYAAKLLLEKSRINPQYNNECENKCTELKELEDAYWDYFNNNQYSEKLEKFINWGFGHNKIGVCTKCQKLFIKKKKSKTYCSDNCRVIANNMHRLHQQKEKQKLLKK